MIKVILMRALQSYELINDESWSSFIEKFIYLNKKAILLEKNLQEVSERLNILEKSKVRLIDFTSENLRKYKFPSKVRYLKARHYLSKGNSGFAIVRGDRIIGDMWYYRSDSSKKVDLHFDVKLLGIKKWEDDFVYTFDIYIPPEERGKNLAAAFQNNAMYALRKKGVLKAYTYFWSDNIPSIWITRVINKWKELETLEMSRFFFFLKGADKTWRVTL